MKDEEIRKILEEKIAQAKKEYITKVTRYQKALEALGGLIRKDSQYYRPITEEIPTVLRVNASEKNQPSFTMKQKIHHVLKSANLPLTARQIMTAINVEYPERKYTYESFSGNFSQTYRKAGVKKYERPNAPIETRTVYGLKEWFEGNDLKVEYLELIGDLI